MKFATLLDTAHQLAIVEGASCFPFPAEDGFPASMLELIRGQESGDFDLNHLLPSSNEQLLRSEISRDEVKLDAPLRNSPKLICIGKNYAEHAAEMGGKAPELPVIFSKFNSAINRPGGQVVLPPISRQVDFEAELVVVIGRSGKNILQEHALDHVFGYCCGNDISARDWQKGKPGGQWLLGKTFDTFAPLGPHITTRDEIPDPHNLRIQLRLNGDTMQDSNTSRLIFRIDFLIAHLSTFVTLEPGDLIFTGTPAGVGAGRKPQVFLKPGDQLEVEIEGLGILKNEVSIAG